MLHQELGPAPQLPSWKGLQMKDMEQFTTPRMTAKAVREAHFHEINRLHSDPEVMRTLSADGLPLPEEKTREGLKRQEEHWKGHGFGFYAFFSRDGGDFIGRAGLQRYDINGQVELGLAYAVLSEHWGKGFATEMARACLEIAFNRLEKENVASWPLPKNRKSQHILEKLGFVFEQDFEFAGLPHRFYRLKYEDYQPGE
jgi:[ribosomal protein S5]-alanine N-acetyltransferase